MITRLAAYIVGSMVSVLVVATIFSERFVRYTDQVSVLVFGIVLGVLMAFAKPVLQLISLPLTCLTFGLFALVINAGLFALAGWLTPGISVDLWGAIAGAVFGSVINGIVFSVVDER